jgi:sugar transferase (PEP-CTERM/EpsH1 system associated)
MAPKRNMIFISHRFPYPPVKGEKIRAWHLLRHFAKTWNVHYGCLIDEAADWAHLETVRPFCADLACFPIDRRRQKLRALLRLRPGRPLMLDYYHHAGLQAWVRATMAATPMDLVYIYSTAMAPYVLPIDRPGLVLDMQDIDSEKWTEYARHASPPMRWVWAREGRTLLAYERRAASACDITLLVSEPECRRLETLAPELAGRVHAVEQGVDLTYFVPGLNLPSPYASPAPRSVFTGNMDYWPNADAAIWFAQQVLPLLRARDAASEFIVVGANPSPEVRALAQLPGVTVTGRVADVRPYVAHAGVAVAPLRIARGIQNKVLEAMALGTPVVASPQAFEGVRAAAGQDLLVADGADATAQAIAAVLAGAHPGLRAAGRQAMEQRYGWPATLARLDALLAPLAARPAQAAD